MLGQNQILFTSINMCIGLFVSAGRQSWYFYSFSGAGIAVKYACQGDSVQAFQNIEFNHCNATVYLHVNGNRNGNIAVWSFQNCIRNETIRPEYQSRLILDQNRTITITNFDHFDIAKYVVVISNMDTLPKIYEVRLFLMVAPSKACKPMIQQLGNILKASLNVEDCGKPAAIPYWEGYDGVSNTNKPILELIPGMEAKEYYACIKGVALTCVKNETSHDYCTKFEPEGRKCPTASLETCNANALIVVCLIQGILLFVAIFAIAVIFVRYRLRKENTNEEQANTLLENSKLLRKWKKYFGKLNWADINTLLNDDQRNGFKKYGGKSCLTSTIKIDTANIKSDVDANKRDIGIINRDCKICFRRKMNVFFLPFTHMATCIECSSSLPPCPVCRAEIKQKLTIRFD
ncbi:hypothetical protein ACJMK2_025698 [Sinanodonta woodiana]|uniref:RING-type domain-containing protein n=1 Tax=Sinanodonta woodiana TaxID=1069815 RepID=A0ABD3XJP4_SINWO